jgi:plasmid maintenance system antidote protein VapI
MKRSQSKHAPSGDLLNETKQPEVARLALSRKEAATALGVSVPTLDRLVQRGLLRPSRALRRPLFPVPEIERFLRETSGPVTS